MLRGKGKKEEDKPSPQCELSNLWEKNRKKKLDKRGNGPLLTIHYQMHYSPKCQ
jgi:hypothetical protein